MFYAIVAVIALILDQLSKYWTSAHIEENVGTIPLIPGLVHLSNVHNTGAAFSFLQGARWFFVVLCVLFVAVVIYLMAKGSIRHPAARWSAVIVMAGAVGNCLDRIISGYVVDMIELEFMTFPVFNIADIFITVGVLVFVIVMLLDKDEAKIPDKGLQAAPAASRRAPSPDGAAAPAAEARRAPTPDGAAAAKPAASRRAPSPDGAAAPRKARGGKSRKSRAERGAIKGSLPTAQPSAAPVGVSAAPAQPQAVPDDPFAEWLSPKPLVDPAQASPAAAELPAAPV
ncbi:MAG: signal peptidase II, partial [Oscillospiraceae bacterium]|nr:signal peptidase II [Oscillospiraceae bacterium]